MKSEHQIKQLAKQIRFEPDGTVDERVLACAEAVLEKSTKIQTTVLLRRPLIWRTIMKSRISQLAAAAMIIIVVLFSITFFDKAATPAYALEQTIEARHTIKTVHLRMFERGKSITNSEFSDYWIKYDDTGKLSKLRCNEHDNNGIVGFTIWKDGIKKTWITAENVVMVKKLNFPAKRWEEFAKKFDYELLLKWIDQAKEEIELKIDEPAGDSDFIYVTATSSVHKARLELIVDRKTKLIKKYSEYGLKEHGDEPGMRIEFLAYNQPIDPSRFDLRKVPDNAKVIDKLGDIIPGLRVGDFTLGMSKDEVLSKLGEPDSIMYGDETYTLNNLPRRYLMAFDNVSFFIYDDSVVSIGVYSSLYTFINGLGVGDSEQKIRQAFGGNFKFEEYEKYDVLNYKDKGLRFEIHKKNRSIMEISVRVKFVGRGESPHAVLYVLCEGREIDIGQDRPVVLRNEGDLRCFVGLPAGYSGVDLSRLDLL